MTAKKTHSMLTPSKWERQTDCVKLIQALKAWTGYFCQLLASKSLMTIKTRSSKLEAFSKVTLLFVTRLICLFKFYRVDAAVTRCTPHTTTTCSFPALGCSTSLFRYFTNMRHGVNVSFRMLVHQDRTRSPIIQAL